MMSLRIDHAVHRSGEVSEHPPDHWSSQKTDGGLPEAQGDHDWRSYDPQRPFNCGQQGGPSKT